MQLPWCMLMLELLGGDFLEALIIKGKIMELSSRLNQAELDSVTREQLVAELAGWCEQYFALYNRFKTVPKLVV